jgi:lysozyme family protein
MSTRLESLWGFFESATLEEVKKVYEETCEECKINKRWLKELKECRKELKIKIKELEPTTTDKE